MIPPMQKVPQETYPQQMIAECERQAKNDITFLLGLVGSERRLTAAEYLRVGEIIDRWNDR